MTDYRRPVPTGRIDVDELDRLIDADEIDTVVVAFPDLQGRLMIHAGGCPPRRSTSPSTSKVEASSATNCTGTFAARILAVCRTAAPDAYRTWS